MVDSRLAGREEALLRLEEVVYAHPGAAPLFSGVTLDIRPGSFWIVTGPSGSGKSTLLRLMNRLEEPQQGLLRYKGEDLRTMKPPELRKKLILVQQTPTLADASVADNLRLPFRFRANTAQGDPKPPHDSTLREHLSRFLLSDISLDRDAATLSVGQRQRLCLIRAVLLEPEALLLDEPTSALDAESRAVVEDQAERLCLEKGMAMVMVNHTDYTPRSLAANTLRLAGGATTVQEAA